MFTKAPIRKSHGQSMVEFAFVLMVLVFLIFGISECARALYTWNTVIQTTREAARWAVVNVTGSGDAANILITKNLVIYGNPPSGYPRLPGLSTSMVYVSVIPMETDTNGHAINQKVTVCVGPCDDAVNADPPVPHYYFVSALGSFARIRMPAYQTSLYTESMGLVPPP